MKSLEGNSHRTYTVSDLSLSKGKDGLTGIITVEIYLSKTAIPGFEYKPILENKGKVDPFIQ
ncbi:MAG TPA: hypothetical protein VNU93_07785 [Verrucomicrobiae bacterium]|nr:hypothetical protein [Verrucomicrobiae bacterium]